MVRETVTEQLADRIKQARSAHGWSAQQLADACAEAGAPSLTRGTIAKIESGVRKAVTAEEIAALAFVLQVAPAELLTTEEWPLERRAPDRAETPADTRLHLLIAVGAEGADPREVVVTAWRQDDPGVWPPVPGVASRIAIEELERHVDELVSDAEVAWAGHSGSVALEFLLPHQLIDLPVQQWQHELDSGSGRPLALDYPISVRSRERMRQRKYHRRWRLRWAALTADPSLDRIYFAEEADLADPRRLEAMLSDERWTAVVFTGSLWGAEPRSLDELVTITMRAGLPAVLWHPTATADRLRDFVTSLAEGGGLAELPVRSRAAMLGKYRSDDTFADVTPDLVLIWDDPTRVVPDQESSD